MYYTYIVKCIDNSYYTGSTNNLENRIKRHNAKRGAKYTATRLPCILVYFERFANLKDASAREAEIKNFNRLTKESLLFGLDSQWRHYKGNNYTIVGITDDIILYADSDHWRKFKKEKTIPGKELMLFARGKSQWLDWIEKKLLRFKRIIEAE